MNGDRSHARVRGRSVATGVFAILAMTLFGTAHAEAAETPNEKNQFFNVSLKLVTCTQKANCDGTWRRAFARMKDDDYYYKPDIMNVLEVPWSKKDDVMAEIRGTWSSNTWSSVHVDYGQTCSVDNLKKCGNTLLVYRGDKLTKKNGAGENQVERFRQYEDTGDTGKRCSSDELAGRNQAIAAKLRVKATGRQMVVAAVHFPPGDDKQCVAKNLGHLNIRLEDTWPTRPVTIFAGDFNEKPDVNSDTKAAKRREERPSCWYKKWSARYSATCTSDVFNNLYYDALKEKYDSSPSDICSEWTFNNTKQQNDSGECDSKQRHDRIDYIWLRWETNGDAERLTEKEVDQRVPSANTDRGYHPNSDDYYSDHRMLRAMVRWGDAP